MKGNIIFLLAHCLLSTLLNAKSGASLTSYGVNQPKLSKEIMKLSKFLAIACVGAAALSIGSASAAVIKTYHFTFSGANVSGSGNLTATGNADGSYTATSGSGTETYLGVNSSFSLYFNPAGEAMGHYTFPNSGTYFYFDNKLTPSAATKLDDGGLLFSSTSSNHPVFNLFSLAPGSYTYENATAAGVFSRLYSTSFNLVETTSVPEPASLALFGLGILGLAASRRKAKHATLA